MKADAASVFPHAPYPGLRPFQPDEWAIFCGREEIVLQVIDLLGQRNVALVHGSSGCGKSSLVRAGVLPAMERDHALANRPFAYRIFRPSEGPLGGLVRLFAEALGAPENEEPVAWWSNQLIFSKSIVEVVEERIRANGLDAFCLIVDQFEEVFHWIRERGASDAAVLIDLLCRLGDGPAGRYFFSLVTMRSDYLGECAQFPGLGRMINRCQYFLPNLDDKGLYRAIHEPAAMFDGSIDEAVADRLRFSASGELDQLPVLQHLLMRMSERAMARGRPWTLTLDDLAAVEGTDGALSKHADEIVDALLAGHPQFAPSLEWMFRALIDIDVGGRAVRRPCSFDAILRVAGAPQALVDEAIDRFAASGANFIVVSDPGEGALQRRIDISHEALIRRWRRMTGPAGRSETGWVSREFQDGLVWRSLAVLARTPEARLDPATTQERDTWFEVFREAPERARRYLLRVDGKREMTDEGEWKSVADLIARSVAAVRRKRMRRRALAFAGGFGAIGLLLAFGLHYKRISDQRTVQLSVDLAAEANDAKEQESLNVLSTAIGNAQTVSTDLANVVLAAAKPTIAPNVEQAPPQATQPETAKIGYMWIGSPGQSKMLQAGKVVDVTAVVAGEAYQSGDNIVLRSGTPAPGNISAPAIGVVPVGSTVEVLEAPTTFRTNSGAQHWVRVRVVEARRKTDVRRPAKAPMPIVDRADAPPAGTVRRAPETYQGE